MGDGDRGLRTPPSRPVPDTVMDLERIEAILRLLQRQEHIGELSAEGDGWRLRAKKGPLVPVILLEETPAAGEPTPEAARHDVRAGRVGIFRSPEGPLRCGDAVKRGATVGHIDSM